MVPVPADCLFCTRPMLSFEPLLEWASECGSGSNEDFKQAYDWLIARRITGREAPPYWQALNTLSLLGHVEIDWQNGRWVSAPPVLTLLPSGRAVALLTGGRTRRLLHLLSEFIADERTMGIAPPVRHQQDHAPDAIFLAVEDDAEVRRLAIELGIFYVYSVAQCLSAILPSLDSYLAIAETTYKPQGYDVRRFNSDRLYWTTVDDDLKPGLYEYATWGPPRHIWVDGQGKRLLVDRTVGIYAELRRGSKTVIAHDTAGIEPRFTVPSAAPLPPLHARAVAMCSGLAPAAARDQWHRWNWRFENVPVEIAHAITSSLGQDTPNPAVPNKARRS